VRLKLGFQLLIARRLCSSAEPEIVSSPSWVIISLACCRPVCWAAVWDWQYHSIAAVCCLIQFVRRVSSCSIVRFRRHSRDRFLLQSRSMVVNVPAFIDSRRIGRLQVLVASLCGLVVLFDGLNTQVIGYLGPVLAKDWKLPRSALGPIFSASLAGLMLGLMLIAPLADRFGRKRIIITSTLLFGCFTLLTAAAHGLPDLFFYRWWRASGWGGLCRMHSR
jgi:hypothetical protein